MFTRRLNGLLLLAQCRVPTPSFVIIRSVRDIRAVDSISQTVGLTIRTCRYAGTNEFGLFSINHISKADANDCLREKLSKDTQCFYLVYASWRMEYSWNVIYREITYDVEGVRGSQGGVSEGTRNPDFSVQIPFGFRSRVRLLGGRWGSEEASLTNQMWPYLRRIPETPFYAEVAYTGDKAVVFYEYTDLKRSFELNVSASPKTGHS